MPDTTLEPQLDWEDIQGNVLAGFNKDHQTFLGLKFGPQIANTKAFVAFLGERTTSLREVAEFKHERSRRTRAEGAEPHDMRAAWVATAFSFQGLLALTPEANAFTDDPFCKGLPARSASTLGDPSAPGAPGNVANWVVGKPDAIPDVLIIVAADSTEDLEKAVNALLSAVHQFGLEVLYRETGHDLSFYSHSGKRFPSGHEHFGFKDGISQPGVRGKLPSGADLTPRNVVSDPDDIGPEYAGPGKPLVCAGHFVLGYAQQQDAFPREVFPPRPLGAEPNAIAPAWAANGSFLVFRRLRQDVPAFRAFLKQAAAQVNRPDLDANRLAAMLVGRWPSGAPVIRTPLRNDPAAAAPDVINAFAYGSDNAGFDLPDDSNGTVCPVAAHVRKVNPRDGDTDIGVASATLQKRILRRGIPYGKPYDPEAAEQGVDRGLLFVCYQASIGDQFEFLSSRWMNSTSLPRNPSDHAEGLGFDMLVGQPPPQGDGRVRSAYIRIPTGGTTTTDLAVTNADDPIKDWVIPTGGGYFFAPSLSALRTLLSR